jgi:cyclohexyl-isocyanide hydratase
MSGARRPVVIAMLLHDDMVAIDHVAPATVFKLAGDTVIHLVSRDLKPVTTDIGQTLQPTTPYADCPAKVDLLFVPGGLKGTLSALSHQPTLDFLASRGAAADYIASVCTGSLLLGAAGLLKGYRATSHWYARDMMGLFGAETAEGRVVIDRNRLTAGGATAGIDLALILVARLRDQAVAENVQLVLEYDPEPPFQSGSPAKADPALVKAVLQRRGPLLDETRQALLRLGTVGA